MTDVAIPTTLINLCFCCAKGTVKDVLSQLGTVKPMLDIHVATQTAQLSLIRGYKMCIFPTRGRERSTQGMEV